MKSFMAGLVMLIVCCGASYAQCAEINKLFGKYSDQAGFTSMNINANLKEIQDITKATGDKVDAIRMLSFNPEKGKNLNKGKEFANELKNLNVSGFSEFLSVNDDGERVRILVKGGEREVTEFLMTVIEGNNKATMIHIRGKLNLKNIDKYKGIFEDKGQ